MYTSELVRHVNYGASVYKILGLIGDFTPIRFYRKTADPYIAQSSSEKQQYVELDKQQYVELDKETILKLYTTALCDSITADHGYINIFLK